MTFTVPDDLYYLDTHEWLDRENDTARVGITAFAQDELGDIVFVELPDVGDSFEQNDAFGVIESIKAVSDLYSPVSGSVIAVNDALANAPELVNEDPFGDGWMIELELQDPDDLDALLTAEAYRDRIE